MEDYVSPSDVSPVAKLNTILPDQIAVLQKRAEELREAVKLANRKSETWYFTRPVITSGVLFGGLDPIPTDDRLDPPMRACFNCWKRGHRTYKCRR